MRLLGALKADISFQLKQGFYAVYAVVTIVYMIVIGQLPRTLANTAVPLIIFSDPSVVGFFFIGGVVMLEKVQGVHQYIAVTPLRTREYMISKALSMSLLAETAGVAITALTYKGNINWVLFFIGVFLNSVFFTLYGYVAAVGCSTMNQYFIRMIPYSMVLVLPCFAVIGFRYSWMFDVFPSVAGLKLVMGAFHGIRPMQAMLYVLYMSLLCLLLLGRTEDLFEKSIAAGGESE